MRLYLGVLLGTAVGDALGLPFEGMRAEAIARRAPRLDRFSLLGRRGFVSDDTEQSVLLATCLARHPSDRARCVRAFRRALLGWAARLPWGIGAGTLRACVRIALGLSRSGVRSAGNGAAMRAAIVGAFFRDAPRETRVRWSDALAVTSSRRSRSRPSCSYASGGCTRSAKRCSPAATPTRTRPSSAGGSARAKE